MSSVGMFVMESLRRLGHSVTPFSLSTSWRDSGCTHLVNPSRWLMEPADSRVVLENGELATRFGARYAEWEPQRYKPRKAITDALGQFDLVQVVSGSAVWAQACRGLSKPVFIQVATTLEAERLCGSGPIDLKGLFRRGLVKYLSHLEIDSLRYAAGVFVENQWMLRYVVSIRSEASTFFTPPGVDESYFTPAMRPRRSYFLFVGRVNDPRKNIAMLLRAYRSAARFGGGFPKLILAGSDAPGDWLVELIHEYNLDFSVEIRVRPTREDLRELYRDSLALVLPSLEEGLGIVILEAFSCGTTAIATDCGGPGEIIESPDVGVLVKNRDEAGLALALNEIARDIPRANSMGLSARKVVERRFSYLACGRSFEDGYRKILGRSFTSA